MQEEKNPGKTKMVKTSSEGRITKMQSREKPVMGSRHLGIKNRDMYEEEIEEIITKFS